MNEKEFTLKRATREWVYRGVTVRFKDKHEGVEIVDGEHRVSLHPDTMAALVRLGERELRPSQTPAEECGEIRIKKNRGDDRCSTTHTCHRTAHADHHSCQCGYEWKV